MVRVLDGLEFPSLLEDPFPCRLKFEAISSEVLELELELVLGLVLELALKLAPGSPVQTLSSWSGRLVRMLENFELAT